VKKKHGFGLILDIFTPFLVIPSGNHLVPLVEPSRSALGKMRRGIKTR